MALTPKQSLFVIEYLKDLNGTKAAVRAGYSEKTANEQASRLLTNVYISDQVRIAMEERGTRTKITADRVLHEIERLAMFDPKDLTRLTGPKDIENLPEEVRRAIVGWKWDKNGNFMVDFAKEKALEMLGRHHGLFVDRQEITGANGAALIPTPVYNIVNE